MKQLSLRLFAPLFSTFSILVRLLQFSSRKINLVFTAPQRLMGKWRLYLNYCPECNSCAPKMHKCDVCQSDTKAYFAWDKEVEQTLWKRYSDKHNFVV